MNRVGFRLEISAIVGLIPLLMKGQWVYCGCLLRKDYIMRTMFSVLFCLLIASCAFSRGNVGTKLLSEKVALVEKVVSTQEQVVNILGAPDRVLQGNGQQLFQYYHYDMKHGTFLFFSRVNIASDDLYVLFNREGVVEKVVFGTRTDQLKFQFWPFGD